MTRTTQSRQRPWPYDAYIGDARVMLLPDEGGNLVGRKTRTLDQSAPTSFEYGSANPMKERTFLWSKLFAGFGQMVAPLSETPRRYAYATNADCSIDGSWMKGPRFEDHVETITGAGEIRQFVKALHGGVETLFAICQNGVWRRAADGNWVASLTASTSPALPAGVEPQQAIRFKNRGAAVFDALYLGVSAGNLWRYNSATNAWTVAASTTEGPGIGSAAGEARYLEKVGDELWVAGDYWIMKVEENPFDRSKYAGAIYIGDQSAKTTWLKQVGNTLYVFKADGIYTVSATGVDQELFPTLRGRPNSTNGKNASVWIDQMWIPYGGQTYRLDANGGLVPDGLEQLLDNRSEVRGQFVAGAGHNTWFFYEVYYNNAGTSFLIKHGTWVDDGTGRNVQFVNSAHHGSLARWSKRATSCEVVPDIHPSGNDRLYVGFADGTLEWCVLPRTGPSPANDAACEFTSEDSYVYLPIHHSNYQADNKLYWGVSAFGEHLTSSEWAEVEYRTDLTNTLAAWVTLDPANPQYTVPGQRKNFPTDTPVYARAIQIRIKLAKDPDPAVSPKNITPILEGIGVHEQVRPSISLEYTFSIQAGSFVAKRDGTVDRRRSETLKQSLLAYAAAAGPVTVTMPDGSIEPMTITDYQEMMVPSQKRRDLEWAIRITAIQLATISQIQPTSGLTYGTLEQYNYGGLEALL